MALSGQLILDTGTDYASNIYVGVEGSSGEETLYYVTQRGDGEDYSQFSMSFEPKGTVRSINLYLETEDAVYVIRDVDVAQVES